MITNEMIERAYCAGIIHLEDSPHGDGTVCRIGAYWFYFGGQTAEEYTAVEYLCFVPYGDIVREISETLSELRMECPDEYGYYDAFIREQLYAFGLLPSPLVEEVNK